MRLPDSMSQRQASSNLKKYFPTVLGILVVVSMASLDYLDWRRRTSPGSEEYMKFIAAWDNEYLAVSRGKGVFIQFQNLKTNAYQETARVYFRGNFILFPLPVIAAPEGTRINRYDDLADQNMHFHPNGQWLAAHGVGSILVIDGSHGYDNPVYMIPVPTTRPTSAVQ
jgi:hypothetical protein